MLKEDQEHYDSFFRICEEIIEASLQKNIENQEENVQVISDSLSVEDNFGKVRFFVIDDSLSDNNLFQITERKLIFRIADPDEQEEDPVLWFYEGFQHVIDYLLKNINPMDYIGFILHTPCMKSGPSWLHFRLAHQLNIEVIWQALQNIMQSNSDIFSDAEFTIELTKVAMPTGFGRIKGLYSFEEISRRRNSIIEIVNKDNLCLPRALIVAEALITDDPCFKQIKNDFESLQQKKAQKLVEEAGVNITNYGAGISELKQFQKHFKNFNICVYDYRDSKLIFEGHKNSNLPRLNLLYNQNHFNVIKNIKSALGYCYFCEKCHVFYSKRIDHSCKFICSYCKNSPPCLYSGKTIFCSECLRKFPNQICFQNHLKYICSWLRNCGKCLKIYRVNKNREHICGEFFCRMCQDYKKPNHLCYIKVDKKSTQNNNNLFIYYDFETRLEQKKIDQNLEHNVCLCVIQQSCSTCCDNSDLKKFCPACGIRQHIFKKDPIKNFLSYVLLPRNSFKNIICIAHNSKSFDCQFILKYLVENLQLKPKIILNGCKIMLMQISKIKFIDSINFLPMCLADLPEAMNLSVKSKKGYFPHLFNNYANRNYIGKLPDSKYFGVDFMSQTAREQFFIWYNKQIYNNNVCFDLEKELVKYCVIDVEILRKSCEKFRRIFIEICDVCPFSESVTIASVCNRVFRRFYLKPETIGIIPLNGYRLRDSQSKIALQWLIYEENSRGILIQHAGRGCEVYIEKSIKVDGFYEKGRIVFEFLGCFWHGCPDCFKTNRNRKVHVRSKETFDMKYEKTMNNIEKIKNFGYTVVFIWECQFNKKLKRDNNLKKFLDNHEFFVNYPIQPRDAFYGGRTGNTCKYKKVEKNEKIKYIDINSLYPFICKYGKYPIGHPKVFVGSDCSILCPNLDINKVEGVVKCVVLPPKNLFHPVLPIKMHNKLMFVLCRTCCDNLEQTDCNHSDAERQLTGTWISDELRYAIVLGYKIIELHEIWQYECTVYDRVNKTGGLFGDYVNTFLKIKQEASGFPEECVDDVSQEEYIKDFYEKEGVLLNSVDIMKNSGKRNLAKLMLNSFWGKFAQSENKSSTTIISSREELYDLFTNPSVQVNRIIPAGEKMAYVHWCRQGNAIEQLRTSNVIIAAYTTAQARIHLHKYLNKLGENVLYYDTDSIIYCHSSGNDYEPGTGNYLGDFKDELLCYGSGSFITEFVCAGPKSYAYKVYTPATNKFSEICKVKGFSLHYNNSKLINFDSMKKLILDNSNNKFNYILTINDKIQCTPNHSVVTKMEVKKFHVNCTKRKLVDGFNSIPYGYKKQKKN